MVAECLDRPVSDVMLEGAGREVPLAPSLSRSQIMLQILELNPTATPSFLMRFDNANLAEYLEHLAMSTSPRGRESTWVRRGLTRAIVCCESLA